MPWLVFRLEGNRPPQLTKLVTAGTAGVFCSSTERCPPLPWPSWASLQKGNFWPRRLVMFWEHWTGELCMRLSKRKDHELSLGWGTGCF